VLEKVEPQCLSIVVSVLSVKMLAFHVAPKFDIILHTTPSTDEDEHADINHICGMLEPLEYSGTEVLLTL